MEAVQMVTGIIYVVEPQGAVGAGRAPTVPMLPLLVDLQVGIVIGHLVWQGHITISTKLTTINRCNIYQTITYMRTPNHLAGELPPLPLPSPGRWSLLHQGQFLIIQL